MHRGASGRQGIQLTLLVPGEWGVRTTNGALPLWLRVSGPVPARAPAYPFLVKAAPV